MPTEKNDVIIKGTFRLAMLEALDLENIEIRQLPAHRVYEYYLTRKKMPIEELVL